MLELQNLTASFGKKKILKNINCQFRRGKIYAIMGPNGSGKSTLAATIMGHPAYKLSTKSKIIFKKKNITKEKPDKRGKLGIFLSFQSPLSLTGVNIYQLLRYALDGKKDVLTIRREVRAHAKKLRIHEDLLTRSLNDGFSGGEKKKMEVLQAIMLDPDLIFFDEIDTGVDVDAMKTTANFLKKMKGKDKTFVLITHYNRILKFLQPDEVIVIIDGKIAAKGDKSLATKIEKDGYDKI